MSASSGSAAPHRAHDAPYADAAAVEELCAGFVDLSLPPERWSHRAHLTVALRLVRGCGYRAALALMRDGLKRYNAVYGTTGRGYHETLTVFYMRVVARYARETPAGDPAADANLLYDRYGDRELPFRYYSRERLFSAAAKEEWVGPDLDGA
ncbi:MAG TPA: hypothetical protein VFK09_01625 [Gemmatimonadales bacterium]|nr:hypothetical protein [Gemmatimonadales bacterium]